MRTFLFLFGIIALVVIGMLVYSHGRKEKNGLNALFSPIEIATMIKKNSVDYIAGECEAKHFKLDKQLNTAKGMDYDFFYGYKGDFTTRGHLEDEMIEKLTTWYGDHSINYAFRDKNIYRGYIDLLMLNDQAMPDTLTPYAKLLPDSTYIFNGCLFQVMGYSMNDNGFVIHAESIDRFIADHKIEPPIEAAPAPAPEPKPTLKTAYIAVNIASVFSKPDESYKLYDNHVNEIKIEKGTKLKIIREGGGFYYCDFTDANGKANTGWIKQADINF